MKIAFICQYYVPEIGAPSARISELCREWVGQGHEVTVVTGFPNHPTGIIPPEYRGAVFRRESIDGITVLRNWLYATPNEGFVRKTLSHLSFMVSSLILSTPRLRGQDVIVVSSPAFFAVISAWIISRIWRVPFLFEVRDLWPGVFIELGVLKSRLLIRVLEGIEMGLYRAAARVVVVTHAFRKILIDRGLPPASVVTITNGVDLQSFSPGRASTDIRRLHGLEGRFIVLYIGAHGISQALGSVLDAAQRLTAHEGIAFVFVGEGAEKKMLREKAATLGLQQVHFFPGQPKDQMASWYAAADAVLVPLRNIPLFETFIPSKMFEIMASGRPIIGSVRGEARTILERSEGALLVDPEDDAGIAEAVLRLQQDSSLGRRLGEAGRRFVEVHYDRRALARTYLDVLSDVVGRRA